jgi:hypothetical protein
MNHYENFWGDLPEFQDGTHAKRARSKRSIERRIAVMEMGRNVCFGGGKGGGDAPSPDPNIGKAAMKNAEIGEDWLAFAREQFAAGNVRQEEMDDLTTAVIDQQLVTAEQQADWATKDRDRYENVFQPLQDEFVKEAGEYGSPERQAQAAAEARTDIMKASSSQKGAAQRQMASMGINPNSGRFRAIERSADVNTAVAAGGASNAARQMIRDKGLALKADAINIGSGLPSQTATAAGIGLNAGNSAVNNQGAANSNFYQNNGVMGQGFGGAMQGYSNQGNILSDLYGNQVQAWQAQQQANATSAGGIGSMVGTIAGAGISAY